MAIGELVREVVSEAFELDGRVFRTLRPFFLRPGYLTREYISGKRARYTSPFRLFLAATLLWLASGFIAEQFDDFDGPDANMMMIEMDESSDGSWFAQQTQAFKSLPETEQAKRIASAARESLPKAALLLIPAFAALMKLLFIRQDRYYVEHLVFALHVHAFGFVVMAVARPWADHGAYALGLLSLLAYLYAALYKVYEVRWWTAAVRLGVIAWVHGLLLALASFLLILANTLLG